MTKLATDPALLSDVYDVLIVGSGYGGAITAARLGFANHQRAGSCGSRCSSAVSSPQGVGSEYYGRARRMLGANLYRSGQGFAKASVFDAIAERAGMQGEPVPIIVNRSERVTRYGTQRAGCTNCGDCCMLCNVGAKNTLASLGRQSRCRRASITRAAVYRTSPWVGSS